MSRQDEEDGIAKSKCTRDMVGYTPFFDDRYPERCAACTLAHMDRSLVADPVKRACLRYSMIDPVVRKKYTASSLLKQAAAILPVHTSGCSSPCRGHA